MLGLINNFVWYENWFIQNALTLLFLLLFVLFLLGGLFGGARKSKILLIHTIVAGGIAAIIFIVITSKFSDGELISFVNGFMPNGQSIQSLIGVSQDADTIEKIIVEMAQVPEYEELILKIYPYINVFVEMVFRFAVFLVCWVIYFVLEVLLRIIYHIFYPVRRYKRKKKKQLAIGIGTGYQKRPLQGMLIAGIRAVLILGVAMSFVGTLTYIVSGAQTEKNEYVEENEPNAQLKNTYYFIKNQGTTGVFGMLNKVRDNEDVPYYLLFANYIIKGELKTGNEDIDGYYYASEELASLTSMALGIADIAFEYNIVNENMEITLDESVFENEELINDLNTLIDEFKTPKLTKALLMGAIDTITTDYESLMSSVEMEGKTGDLLMDICEALFVGDDAIKLTDLVTENDVRVLLQVAVEVISCYYTNDISQEDTQGMMILASDVISSIIPYFEELSIFSDPEVSKKFNRALNSIYDAASSYVEVTVDDTTYTLKDIVNLPSDLEWSKELVSFLELGADIFTMIANNNVDFEDTTTFLGLFDSKNEKYEENLAVIEKLGDTIGDSKLFTSIFSSELIYTSIETLLSNSLSCEFTIPRDVQWANETVNGTKVKGEISNLFTMLTNLVDNGIIELFDSPDGEEIALSEIVDVVAQDNIIECIDNSTLVYYILSGVISGIEIEGIELYIPDSIIVNHSVNNVNYELIKREEISTILDGLGSVLPIIENSSSESFDVAALLEDDGIIDLINDSTILGGTVVYLLVDNFANMENSPIIIPESLNVTHEDDSKMTNWLGDGKELDKIIDILKNVEAIKKILNNEEFTTSMFTDMSDTDFDLILASDVIYHSACNLIATSLSDLDMTIIIPSDSYETGSQTLVKKSELKALKNCMSTFITDEEFDLNKILDNSDVALSSNILHATMIYYISDNLKDQITLPKAYKDEATKEELEGVFAENIWYTSQEISHVLDSIDALGISLDNFEFNQDVLTDIVNDLDDAKMDTVLSSVIVWYTFGDMLQGSTDSIIKIPSVSLETIDTEQYIKKAELKSLINSLKLFGDVDLNNFDFSIVGSLVDDLDNNVETLYASNILQYTLATELVNISESSEESVLKVPQRVFTNLTQTEKILIKAELKSLIKAINALGDQPIDNIDSNFILTITDTQATDLVNSDIVRYTMSYIVLDMTNSNTVKVPSSVKEDLNSDTAVEEIAITKAELENMIASVKTLGVSNFSGISADNIINISSDKVETLVSSDIMRYTISDKLGKMNSIIIPNKATMYFDTLKTEQALTKEELENVINGIKVLNLTSFNNIDADVITSLDSEAIDTLLMSDTLQYTISDKMFDLSNVIDIPSVAVETYTTETCDAIYKTEIKNIILGVQELGVQEFNSTSFDENSLLDLTETQVQTVCASYVLHYTLSEKLMDLSVISVPANAIAKLDTNYSETAVTTTEICNVIEGINVLALDDLNNIDVDTLLSLTDTEIDTICESYILHYTMSCEIEKVSLDIPSASYDNTVGELAITKSEIKYLIQGVNAIDMTNLGDVDANVIMDDTVDLDVLFTSTILRYTISLRIKDVESGSESVVNIPNAVYETYSAEYPTEKGITKVELVSLVDGLKELGIDLSGDSSVDPNAILDDSINLNNLFNSMILRYTISDKIESVESGSESVVDIPTSVYETYSSEYPTEMGITKTELVSLVRGLKALDVDLSGDSSISTEALDSISIQTAIQSSILHYTVSEKIVAIADTFTIPSEIMAVIKTGYSEIAIPKSEIVNLIVSLEVLGISFTAGEEFSSDNINGVVFHEDFNSSTILIATVTGVINENFAIGKDTVDSSYQTDVLNTDIIVMFKQDLYEIVTEFTSLGIDIADDGSVDALTLVGMISQGHLDIQNCSETTYIFVATLLEDLNSFIINVSSYEHGDVVCYPKGTMTTQTVNILTRDGVDALADFAVGIL